MNNDPPIVEIVTVNNVRFEGIVCWVNKKNRTISIKNAVCYGTEDRDSRLFIP